MLGDLRITIITATYSSLKTLEQTIKSVENQSYKNIQYIIIDGGSNDGTVGLIKHYADKGVIDCWISEKDNGIYDAFNKGIDLANGAYTLFVGSDDCLYNDFCIDNVVKEIVNSKVDVFSGAVICVDKMD